MAVKGENKQLLPRHYVIMRMQVQGFSRDEISEATGLTPAAITLITSSDIYREEFRKLNEKANDAAIAEGVDIRKKIRELSIYGVHELENILKSADTGAKVKADIVFELLDRDGVVAPEKDTDFAKDYAENLRAAYEKRKSLALANSGTKQVSTEHVFIPARLPAPQEEEPQKQMALGI